MTNTDIEEGDAIVLFYAGHGSRVMAPDGWPAPNGMIQTLCPSDDMMKDEQGNEIYGIPDRTINAMLRELAAKKGDNITVIFDCCCSAGFAPTFSGNAHSRERFVDASPKIKPPPSLDKHIWGPIETRDADISTPSGFRHSMTSHVLPAACEQDQCAHEITFGGCSRGFFTYNLVRELRNADLRQVTCVDLLNRLPKRSDQNPHCEGLNKNRVLFNGKVVT